MTTDSSVQSSVGRVRQATVVVINLSEGGQSSNLPPEALFASIESCFTKAQSLAEQAEGRFEILNSRAALAIFGLPPAAGSDPEAAIRLALDVQAFVQASAQALTAQAAARYTAQIGLSTGPASFQITRQFGREQVTLMGDALQLAQRLAQAAPPAGILVAHDTFRFVRGVFIAEEKESIVAAGHREPQRTYLVTQLKPRAFRTPIFGIEGVEPPMIGRDAEFLRLQTIFQTVIDSKRGHMVTVVGEPGIGKSRMYYELNNWLELRPDRFFLFRGRAMPDTVHVPYGLIRDLFAYRFEILESDQAEAAREKLVRGMIAFSARAGVPEAEATERAHFIGQLIGFDFSTSPYLRGVQQDATQLRARAFEDVVQLFSAAASVQPVVMLVGDLHWADNASLEMLQQVAQRCAAAPIFIVNFTRPQFYDDHPNWGAEIAAHERLDLQPLPVTEARRLVETILSNAEGVSAHLIDQIIANADGNPFHVEELVKMLVADGAIVVDDTGWHIEPTRLGAFRVPGTLTEVLQARLNRLSESERSVLQRAAVIGRIFWDRPVAQLTGDWQSDGSYPLDTARLLAALSEKELIYRQDISSFAGATEYAFRHTLLWDVTYQSVPLRERQLYHAQVADWLTEAATASGRLTEVLTIVADHYTKAARPQRATRFLTLAGDHAAQLSAFAEAQKFYSQALALVTNVGQERIGLLLKLGEINAQLGSYPEAQLYLETVLMLARSLGGNHEIAEALYQLGILATQQGEFAHANVRLGESLELARTLRQPATLARVLYGLGDLAWRLNQQPTALAYLQESLDLARKEGDAKQMLFSLNRLGVVKSRLGDVAGARLCWQEGKALALQEGNRERLATILNNLGKTEFEEGHYHSALENYQQGLAIGKEAGLRNVETLILLNLSDVSTSLGQWFEAERYAREALVLGQILGALPYMLVAFINFARLRTALNQSDDALELLGLALNHPAADVNTRGNAAPILDELERRLGQLVVEQGLVKGQHLNFDTMVRTLCMESR
jgi:predicted ATPase/class 3 adenylate cyclase